MVRSIFIITLFFLFNYIYADCSDLDSTECAQWAEYCEWNEDTDQCQDIGGGGGDEFGPYDILSITQSDGMRNGPLYADATLYYPIGSELLPTVILLIFIVSFMCDSTLLRIKVSRAHILVFLELNYYLHISSLT